MKKILSACVKKHIEFDTAEAVEKHIAHLKERHIDYSIDHHIIVDGKHQIFIREQYNNAPLFGGKEA